MFDRTFTFVYTNKLLLLHVPVTVKRDLIDQVVTRYEALKVLAYYGLGTRSIRH